MSIIVRPATPADLPTLRRFEQGVISAERPMDPTIQDGPIHYYDLTKMLASPHIHLVVAETAGDTNQPADTTQPTDTTHPNDQPILIGSGYARIDPSRHYLKHTHHAYCGFMYVEPAYRGKGVNQLIIDALKTWAKSKNLTELRLDVYTTNDAAIRAYVKAGFTPYLINMRMGI
ncbi:MAG TPA: GNAT family N-acetyltransferase [Puia sp.]|nr:GNAT family N-acetyltransferase [Puia sp.]